MTNREALGAECGEVVFAREFRTICSRRREEADRGNHLAHPPPYVGGYIAQLPCVLVSRNFVFVIP